ncbi:MAG: pitrilysin family protein [Acidobacteriota bacterium]|nr:pitrilysin family protein [Acidobacteriota bacterium]
MKAKTIFRIATACAVLACLGLTAAGQKHPRDLGPAPDLEFKLVPPVEFTLSNGIRCLFIEDRELPLVSLRGVFKGGSLYEPAEKSGLASLMGTVLRTGGTKKLTGDQINDELEFIAASIESMAGSETISVVGSALRKDFDKLVELYADIVRNPEFRQDKIDLARNQSLESMRRRWDQPMLVARLLFSEKLYGSDTPFGRRATPASLASIARQDLLDFHAGFFTPGNMILGIVGDLSAEEAREAFEKAFGTWPAKPVVLPDIPRLEERADGTITHGFRDTPQGNVIMGHLGVERGHPDEFKILVMNDILGGGGFTARLMRELRSNRGLTYGIYGGVFEGPAGNRGVFQIASQLKADKFVEALEIVKDIIRDMQNNLVTDEEMAVSKNSLINSFVFRFQEKSQVLAQFMGLKVQGFPDDYFDTYIDNIRGITKEDIRAAARKHMDPDRMIIVVVGDEKRFDKPLAEYGKVESIDIKALQEAEKVPAK